MLEQKLRDIFDAFLAKIAHEEYDEDEEFDFADDVTETILNTEFPGLLNKDDNGVEEELYRAAWSYISSITERIKRGQKEARTEKMIEKVIARGREFFSRIKPRL